MSEVLGQAIRSHRLRRRQIHNDEPWSQEDLAVAIGSDKSHINRIERGHQRPTLQTLVRICDALQLGWEERSILLGLAGHLLAPPSPTDQEVEAAVCQASASVQAADYPAGLVDQEVRVWDANDLLAMTFNGYRGRDAYLAAVRGLSTIELLFLHPTGDWWRRVIVDYDAYVRRHVAQLRRRFLVRQQNHEYQVLLDKLLAQPAFKSIWEQLGRGEHSYTGAGVLDHQLLTVDHPEFGRYTVQIWHSRLASDDRFWLTHQLPADEQTRRLFAELAAHVARKPAPAALETPARVRVGLGIV